MHNLQPAVGEVNGDRGNFMYSQWNGGRPVRASAPLKVDFKDTNRRAPARARGAIARTYSSICAHRYQLRIFPASKPQLCYRLE